MKDDVTKYKGLWTLVTGADRAGRVGAQIARHMATLGSNVYVHYLSDRLAAEEVMRDVQEAGKAHGVLVELVTGDLGNAEDVTRLFETISPDIVINNAGVFAESAVPKNAHLGEHLEAHRKAFDANMNSNAKSAILVTEAALYRMKETGKTGTIFFVGDASLEHGAIYNKDLMAYTISRVSIPVIARCYAAAWGEAGFRFFAILNGPIEPTTKTPAHAVEAIRDEIHISKEKLHPWIGSAAVAEAIELLLHAGIANNGASFPVDGARGWNIPHER